MWLVPGDPALKGARALFDEQSGTVCCEKAGGPGERALLVAHEIEAGMAPLGGLRPDPAMGLAAVDPAKRPQATQVQEAEGEAHQRSAGEQGFWAIQSCPRSAMHPIKLRLIRGLP